MSKKPSTYSSTGPFRHDTLSELNQPDVVDHHHKPRKTSRPGKPMKKSAEGTNVMVSNKSAISVDDQARKSIVEVSIAKPL